MLALARHRTLVRENGLAFAVPASLMLLQEASLLRGLGRIADAYALLSRAGFGNVPIPGGTIDGILFELAATLREGVHCCVCVCY